MTEHLPPSRIAELRKLAETAETLPNALTMSKFYAAVEPQIVIALLDVAEAAQALVATEEGGEQDHAFRKLAEAVATLSPEKQP